MYMKKCCFIIPFFGKFNDYFPVFLKTCGVNKDFNWLIITDNPPKEVPKNISILNWTFCKMQDTVNERFGFKVSLTSPYKLCDLKPMYGFIFEDYIKEYQFWGYCDVDTLMGNLGDFITDEIMEHYDKMFCLGHMTLFRNTHENNRVFMTDYNNQPYYKNVLSTDKICVFDEDYTSNCNINTLFKLQNKKILYEDWSLNFDIRWPWFVRRSKFECMGKYAEHGYSDEKYRKAVYLWEKGNICRYYMDGKELIKENFMYVHLQQRKMKVDISVLDKDIFKLIPNQILPLEVDKITVENFSKIKHIALNDQYYRMVIKPNLLRLRRSLNL